MGSLGSCSRTKGLRRVGRTTLGGGASGRLARCRPMFTSSSLIEGRDWSADDHSDGPSSFSKCFRHNFIFCVHRRFHVTLKNHAAFSS